MYFMYYALLALFTYGHARQKWDTSYRGTELLGTMMYGDFFEKNNLY